MMRECWLGAADTFRCPTKWDLWRQAMALLPRGRAWQTHEDSTIDRVETGHNAQVGTFEVGATGIGAEPVIETLTVLEQYWAAHAEVLDYLHRRACALLEEFFCATTVEQRAEWGIDYGFPDPCEPWDDLCHKVAAQGGATCAYIAGVAARRGWSVTCVDCVPIERLTAGNARAGCARPCGCPPFTLIVRVSLADSPSYTAPVFLRAKAGRARAGKTPMCGPAVTGLLCLIERIKPAHIRAIYEVV